MEGKLGRMIGAIQRELAEFGTSFSRIEVLPSKESLMASFSHKEECPADVPLIKDKMLVFHEEGFMPTIFGPALTCPSCHVSQRYQEE